jgi:acyl-CoA synthetase (AMP-forming)/AMP-acid ligase II
VGGAGGAAGVSLVTTLLATLARRAAEQPRRLAFAMNDERLHYGELAADAMRLARTMLASGVAPGDRVALLMPAGLELVRLFFAVQLAGAAPCALAPGLPAPTLVRRLRRLRPALALVAEARLAELGVEAAGALPLATPGELRRHDTSTAEGPLPPVAPAAVAHLQLTSGTSGEPRAAVVTHAAVAANLERARRAMGFSHRDRLVSWVPPWHDLGLYYGLLYPLACGCESYLVEPAIATLGEWLRTISRVGGTFSGAPDFAYRIACRTVDPQGIDLSSLRGTTNGGEPVRRATVEAFEARFGLRHRLFPGYGSAEANLGIAVAMRNEPLRVHPSGAVSCGPPMPGVQVRIVATAERSAAPGETGEILVHSASLFSGYLDAPDDTTAALRDGWLHTGDAGFLDEDGELYVVGRHRNLLKRAGGALAPRELEEVADAIPGVRASAAVAVGEQIVLVAEVSPPLPTAAAALAVAVASALRAAMRFAPDVLLVVPRTIPRTENGKVCHGVLQAQLTGDGLPPGAVLFDGGTAGAGALSDLATQPAHQLEVELPGVAPQES